jgi:conjugative relaxase-like TrwC/TraI family protein
VLTLSKPLSAAQALAYHAEEFGNGRENYYAATDEIRGHWHGRLAERWGLTGEVRDEQFARLAEGQHPLTGEALVRYRTACRYTNERGQTVTTMAHRAGWDATFSAPKSVSLTALVGGDARVRAAHEASVRVALGELEQYVQARVGNHPAETTGQWVAACFEHDSARPVDGYTAPQLHTHAVIFNLTETSAGEIRPLQPRELYKTQQYATAVYRSELATRLTDLGYAIERGAHGQPEVRGYSPAYLEASSPRRQQIQAYLEQHAQHGAGAAQIAAHHTREAKQNLTPEVVQRQHHELAASFGHQPTQVVAAARERALPLLHEPETARRNARVAVTFARDRQFERQAVVDERQLLGDALARGMGDVPPAQIQAELARRIDSGEFVQVDQAADTPGRAFTTRAMIALEQDTIDRMQAGQGQQLPLVPAGTAAHTSGWERLHEHQRVAVDQVLASRDQVTGLDGVAGTGKTTALAAIREAAERGGYHVEGLAPTSRAAQQLESAGIGSRRTLQAHLAHSESPASAIKRLYVLDESSLASTRQLNAFLHRLDPEDRVLLVGDVRQHHAVDAGRPYQQLQEAGLQTAHLDTIVRQRDPNLRAVVEQLSRGNVQGALEQLDRQRGIHEIPDREQRFRTIARAFVDAPDGTLVVSPDNASRIALNAAIHQARQASGQIPRADHRLRVLLPRQDLTGADRQWAVQYQPGDVVRYTRGSRTYGFAAGDSARVTHVNPEDNLLTVTRKYGVHVTYDPRRLQGVTVHREAERAFSIGDRVQFTAPDRQRHIANRELATIDQVTPGGRLRLHLDSGRTVALTLKDFPHLDHGYAVTSYTSQGQTADRVLVHVDTEHAPEQLVNRRLAYVALSRGRFDAQIFTDDTSRLIEALSRDVSQHVALDAGHAQNAPAKQVERGQALMRGFGLGL